MWFTWNVSAIFFENLIINGINETQEFYQLLNFFEITKVSFKVW